MAWPQAINGCLLGGVAILLPRQVAENRNCGSLIAASACNKVRRLFQSKIDNSYNGKFDPIVMLGWHC